MDAVDFRNGLVSKLLFASMVIWMSRNWMDLPVLCVVLIAGSMLLMQVSSFWSVSFGPVHMKKPSSKYLV